MPGAIHRRYCRSPCRSVSASNTCLRTALAGSWSASQGASGKIRGVKSKSLLMDSVSAAFYMHKYRQMQSPPRGASLAARLSWRLTASVRQPKRAQQKVRRIGADSLSLIIVLFSSLTVHRFTSKPSPAGYDSGFTEHWNNRCNCGVLKPRHSGGERDNGECYLFTSRGRNSPSRIDPRRAGTCDRRVLRMRTAPG